MLYFTDNDGCQSQKKKKTNHLCEAFALCESIIRRYTRSGTTFSADELNAIHSLQRMLPKDTKAAKNDFPSTTASQSFLNSLAAPQAPVPASVECDHILQLMQKCDLATKSPREVVKSINAELSELTGYKHIHSYFVNHNDALLFDPVNGVAAPLDATTAVGKSAAATGTYIISNTLYIPVRTPDRFIGCIEIPGASTSILESSEFSTILQAIAILLRNVNHAVSTAMEMKKAAAMLTMATRLARDTLDESVLVQSIMNTAKSLTESDRCSIFIVKDNHYLEAHFEDGNVVSIPADSGIAGYVARTGNVVNITSAYEDERFNRDVDKATGYHTKTILCLPVVYDGAIVAVAQLINKLDLVTESGLHLPRTFGRRDEELFQTFSMFAAASLRNCRTNENLLIEKKKSDAILDVVTLLSNTDIRDVDEIVRHVLHGAKKLLNADRSSLFLLDKERNELYSRMADSVSGNEIRFPSGYGIAGTVAASGVGENILDAYKDARFNSTIDRQLGYRTQSILCEPIVLNGEVLAVVQLVNKLDDDGTVTKFTQHDMDTFKVFSLFAGISINNSHLLEFAVNAGREAMELNERRNFSSKNLKSNVVRAAAIDVDERNAVMQTPLSDKYDLTSTTFNLFDVRENAEVPLNAAVQVAYRLILSTGLPQKFKCGEETLLNFILQCRRKYRHVPYHNFFHVVDVCQTVHTFLYAGKASEFLTELECYVLLITALVHDLDHMGVNNSFYLKTDSPLGILSSASGNNSVLEVHHCNLAIEILADPESDVFHGLQGADLTLAYRALIDCVLATDMARHADELTSFKKLVNEGFVRDNEDHRRRVMEILIKAADVSNVSKPFEISRLWAMAVTEEFYRQGDMEKEKGVEVLPMFDRSKNTELARGQIGFIDFVAGKYFKEIVTALLHGMQWCVDNVEANRAEWQALLDHNLSARPSVS